MRHRTRTATAALVCALTLAGCGDGAQVRTTSADGTTAGSSASDADEGATPTGTSIPDDFPLAAGLGGPGDEVPTARTGTGLRGLTLCGTAPLRGLAVRDRMVADNSGGEAANTRELVLLGTPEEAAALARSIVDLPRQCPTSTVDGDMETVTEVRDSPFGAAPASALVQTYTFDGAPGTGATVVHVVPVGAAVLITSTYGQWDDTELEQAVRSTVRPLRATVDALALFDGGTATAEPGREPTQEPTEDPTEDPTGEPTGEPTADAVPDGPTEVPTQIPTQIPADFPLAVGLPDPDADIEVSRPSADGDGMGEVEMCGRVVWPLGGSGHVERLVTSAQGPEYLASRELLVDADADAAVAAMAPIHRAARECRGSDHQVWTVLARDTGYDTVTMGLTYSDGLGSSVFQVTRVGSARLMVQTYGEGSLASLEGQADGVTETTEAILPAMCVFTKTGC